MRVLKGLEGKSWKQIKKDPEQAAKLLNETQRTAVLRGWGDESVLYEIFYRLNSGSVKLSPMELRMSLYPGDFLKFILRWTEDIGALHHLLKKRSPDPRMGDVELAVRYLAFENGSIGYRGDLKLFLDSLCAEYNKRFFDSSFQTKVQHKLLEMNSGIDVGIDIFGDGKFCRKYVNGKYENSFNRALFDIFSYSLANPAFRSWAKKNGPELRFAFEELSGTDNAFIRSIEVTTKSVESTHTRFSRWLDKCKEVSGISIASPLIVR